MRIRHFRAIISSAAATAAALLFAASVLAHGGEDFFVAEPAAVAPGAGVAVRGDLPTSGPIRLSLVGTDGSVRELGIVDDLDEGHFEILMQIPADLPAGRWTLRAEADGTVIASSTLEVAGAPVGGEEPGQGGKDEDDPLLAPLPSGWQASRSGPPDATQTGTASRPESIDLVPFIAVGAAALALAVLLRRTRPDRPSGGPSDLSR